MADIATNKQAAYRYHLLEKWECGLVLTGTEVKSLRGGKAQLKDGYAQVQNGEVWLHNVHIAPYEPATRENHEPERPRKLLMHRREIERLIGKTREKGLTLVPDAALLQGPAREGRDRARARQGRRRQAPDDQGARDEARDGAGDPPPLNRLRPPGGRPRKQIDAGESRLRSPPVKCKHLTLWAAGLAPQWPRSLRLILRVWRKPMRTTPSRARGSELEIPASCGEKGIVKARCHTGRHRWTWIAPRPNGSRRAPWSRRPPLPPLRPRRRKRSGIKRFATPIFFGVLALLKWGKALLLLLPKAKLLTTSASMLVSVGAYALIWGWKFAAGFVALLFLHEMGHYIQLRREGVRPSGMVFIPFLGAAVGARSLGGSALAEARVGLAGPILGSLATAALLPIAAATDDDFWRALAFTGFFLNLFNLLPVVPLDGGRAMAAMAPWMWFVGFGAIVVLVFLWPNPILILIALLGGYETYRRWKQRKARRGGQRRLLPRQARAPAAGGRRLRRADHRAGDRDGPHARRAHVRRRLISPQLAEIERSDPLARRGGVRIGFRQTRRTSRKERGHRGARPAAMKVLALHSAGPEGSSSGSPPRRFRSLRECSAGHPDGGLTARPDIHVRA